MKWAHESELGGQTRRDDVNLVRKAAWHPNPAAVAGLRPVPAQRPKRDDRPAHGELLACNSGTSSPSSRIVAYDPDAKCPWGEVFCRIFDGKQALIDYVQRCVGYSLTGTVGEHVLFCCTARAETARASFLLSLQALMADYATRRTASS